mmetsp:Transcript_13193/g.32383  ORF Transcript_13193/g.32383 Transcript_13193/m.32383 type:complete len:1041 (+) Transcript_13193:73-3195(+)
MAASFWALHALQKSGLSRVGAGLIRGASRSWLKERKATSPIFNGLVRRGIYRPTGFATQVRTNVTDSFATGTSNAYIDAMYLSWKNDPSSVHASWAAYFENLDNGVQPEASFAAPPSLSGGTAVAPSQEAMTGLTASEDFPRASLLIRAHQVRGHEMADLDPLGIYSPPDYISDLDPFTHGFRKEDWDRGLKLKGHGVENITGLCYNADVNQDGMTTLEELVNFCQKIYCGKIGFEYMHIREREKCNWIRDRIEIHHEPYTKKQKHSILERLTFADVFERFLATKFGTAKRFGLEGCESMIPGMKALIDRSSELGVQNVLIGMAHRGRLSVLCNVIRKPAEQIFKEFKGISDEVPDDWSYSGDVKYHLGTSFDRAYPDGRQLHLELLANPSHLEAVNPLVLGKTKAKMYFEGDEMGKNSLPMLIHGDAAIAGQGIVYESMQMCGLDGYQTGGTIHVVCNNQVGFTANPDQSRSTLYASDIGKAFDAPIFHVNADHPEEVTRVFELAAEWRAEFHTDVIVDLIGYRRHGHNEIDQPFFTQPAMYQEIGRHPTALQQYSEQLIKEGTFSEKDITDLNGTVQEVFEQAFKDADNYKSQTSDWLTSQFKYREQVSQTMKTGIDGSMFKTVASALTNLPEDFTLHNQLKRILKAKEQTLTEGQNIDWGTAEALAFGSLLMEGVHVRLSGQDSERGTFSHRHAVLHDQKSGSKYVPLNNISPDQCAYASIISSPLSEFGVLGFELGFSQETENQLVLWEAQFGDFSNGAQVIIDQFLSAQENKWGVQSGLVLLLPHGYQGMGPEHSSCRLERFLLMCDEEEDIVADVTEETRKQVQQSNWQVVNCTTPANYFHALRRQVHRDFRKPLIVVAPKDLLRHKLAVSSLEDFGQDRRFQRVISEAHPTELADPEKIRRVVFCSGKVYYEALTMRREDEVDDVVLVRMEQISPFPFDRIASEVAKYPNAEVVWLQEEPKNQGAWVYVNDRIQTATRELNGKEVRPGYVGRDAMAATAEGYGAVHTREQTRLLKKVFSKDWKLNEMARKIPV